MGLGWGVERLTSWRIPEHLRGVPEPVLYLEELFGPTLAASFGQRLVETPVDWLPRLPEAFRKRRITLTTMGQARELAEPWFVKPPNDKSFPARVSRGGELPAEYPDEKPVLVAEVVVWKKEFRCFIRDRQPLALSVYLRDGELQREWDFAQTEAEEDEALGFLREVLADPRVEVPRDVVLNVGVIRGQGWGVVVANAAWGSGIYGCDPRRVLEVLRVATVPA